MSAPIAQLPPEPPPPVDWPTEPALRLRLAAWLAKRTPRGRGAIPRLIGRYAGRGLRSSVHTAHGALLAVDPANLDVYTTIMLSAGRWDDHVFLSCRRLLRPGEVFYDIGANAGYMSISVAHHFRDDPVQVIAFEPQHSLACAILRSAAINRLSGLQVFECLLGESEGEADLFVPAHGIHASTVARESHARRVACRQTTIDTLVECGAIPPPHVMKVDVEGGELAVFRGAERTIRRCAPAMIFESDENMDRFGYGRGDVIGQLGRLNDYLFCGITDGGFVPLEQADGAFIYPDIAAIPRRLEGAVAPVRTVAS